MQIELSADFDVVCDECGAELTATFNQVRGKITVDPCGKCLKTARDEGREEARRD